MLFPTNWAKTISISRSVFTCSSSAPPAAARPHCCRTSFCLDEFLREGSVRLLAIDLKDGVSATACAGFYTKIASTLPEAVDLLQETVELVKKRNAWLKSRHETEIRWSMQTPLIVILIDEALQLYGAASPEQKKLQAQAQEALDALLLTGRSAGIMVIAAVQDPRKEFFKSRDHYPERMALALNSKDEAKMALGDEAVSRGAAPWLISHSTPGRGWYYDDLGHKAIRFQVPPVQADEIRTMSSILEPFTHQQDIKSLTPPNRRNSHDIRSPKAVYDQNRFSYPTHGFSGTSMAAATGHMAHVFTAVHQIMFQIRQRK